ncbi:hypothetical protein HJG53_15730 [Sphingomonas sp. ID1715]|uniref:hypothetical protein n=1 Tax=Sphingomonas sp. ID1715 TaxID=1656898 RepID=UPI001487FBB6|nr:hypothetical protein [Sphingomonas sp. ID1715]NNM78343.1 hypothetical protein [Sphingomonas sp. ID1715]
MSRFHRYNPLTGLKDLRSFLGTRQKHELVFAFLAVVVTVTIIAGFYLDSGDLKKPWQRDVQYVESWPLNRTDAEIVAAQKTDAKNRAIREAAEKKRQEENRRSLKKIDDALTRWGF